MKKIICTTIFALIFIFNAFGQTSVCDPPEALKTIYAVEHIRINLLDTLNKQLYVREVGPNRGPEVDNYLRTVNMSLAQPWCAAFVGSNLFWQGVKNPKTAWAPDYAAEKDIIWKNKIKIKDTPRTGDVATYYYTNIGRIGHVGFFEKVDKDGYFITIEGNTNSAGNREGDGVYRKKRDPDKVYAISRYIK